MIYQIRSILSGILILLGLVHIGFAFPIGDFNTYDLWSIGSGIAIILSGLLNIVAIINCGQRWLGNLTIITNIILFGLFLLAQQVWQGPQVYVGMLIYLLAFALPLVQILQRQKRSNQHKHSLKAANPDLKEVLEEIEVIPMLRIFDKKKAEEFYIEWLGFTLEWEQPFEENLPVYMEITKAGIKLHLTEHHGDCNPGGKVYIVCSGLREYHKQLLDKNYSYNRPGLGNADWGSLEMTVIDPFGNQLLFTEKHKSGGI